MSTLNAAALAVLTTADPAEKARGALAVGTDWPKGILPLASDPPHPPDRPARPDKPELCAPRDMPRRGTGGVRGRIALLHALAHIELNAIDLAFDLIARFAHLDCPRAFFDDWVRVGSDEARHFTMLTDRLAELGARYGDLPAHDGLWDAAQKTSGDILARLAIVPLIFEARGLDVTPATTARLRRDGDEQSADLLDEIYRDEITHVRAGSDWYHHFCRQMGKDPVAHFHHLVEIYYPGGPKPPFNESAREAAALPAAFYDPAA